MLSGVHNHLDEAGLSTSPVDWRKLRKIGSRAHDMKKLHAAESRMSPKSSA
jgi:hypothetical protein